MASLTVDKTTDKTADAHKVYELDKSPSVEEGVPAENGTKQNGTIQDSRDMDRLGKRQQFQVRR